MSLERCNEYRIFEKKTLEDFSCNGELRIRCARVKNHEGVHSFIRNGERIAN